MSRRQRSDEYEPGRQRRRTEWQLVLGGFVILVIVGGLLLWLLWGLTLALIGVGTAILAVVIFALLWLILRALEAWAKSG